MVNNVDKFSSVDDGSEAPLEVHDPGCDGGHVLRLLDNRLMEDSTKILITFYFFKLFFILFSEKQKFPSFEYENQSLPLQPNGLRRDIDFPVSVRLCPSAIFRTMGVE